MSDDLANRLRSHAEWGEAGPKANDGNLLKEAATALEEARAEIERRDAAYMRAVESRTEWRARAEKAESEIERLREQVFELEHGVEDQMEEAAYHAKQRAAAESELSTLRARVREVVGPFARMSSILGFAGATEHDDVELSGEALHGALEAARQLMEEVK